MMPFTWRTQLIQRHGNSEQSKFDFPHDGFACAISGVLDRGTVGFGMRMHYLDRAQAGVVYAIRFR